MRYILLIVLLAVIAMVLTADITPSVQAIVFTILVMPTIAIALHPLHKELERNSKP